MELVRWGNGEDLEELGGGREHDKNRLYEKNFQ